MATYEDLLKLQRPSMGSRIGQALMAAGSGMRGEQPQVQEDTSARDMMSKILIAQMENEKAQATLQESRQYDEIQANIKRNQALEDMATKQQNALELARVKEAAKPPKVSQVAGTGQKTGQRSFANVGGQNVPIRPFTEVKEENELFPSGGRKTLGEVRALIGANAPIEDIEKVIRLRGFEPEEFPEFVELLNQPRTPKPPSALNSFTNAVKTQFLGR